MGDNPAVAYEYFSDLEGLSLPKLLASIYRIHPSLSLTLTRMRAHTPRRKHKIRFFAPEVGLAGIIFV